MAMLANAHALIVGIAAYQHIRPLPDLVLKDARDVRSLLVSPNLGGYSDDPAQVVLLLNQEATREAILKNLEDLAARTDADSVLFLYFSCHGWRVNAGAHSGEYLLPIEAEVTSPEALARTAIAGAAFTEALKKIRSRKATIILDCCHASGIGLQKGPAVAWAKSGVPDSDLGRLGAGRGWAIIASSRDSEESYILRGASNSLFTEHLLAGLKGGAAGEDGFVRVFDLFEYVQPRVTRAVADQHPTFKSNLEENFPVALRLGGTKGAVAEDSLGFRHDAYISYVDREPDSSYVWDTLVPRLEQAGLRLAVSNDSEDPGVARVVGIERAIRESKRTVVVLSEQYLKDRLADFQAVLAQSMGLAEGTCRVLPIKISPVDDNQLPTRLGQLVTLDLTHPRRSGREFDRLVAALKGPLPGG